MVIQTWLFFKRVKENILDYVIATEEITVIEWGSFSVPLSVNQICRTEHHISLILAPLPHLSYLRYFSLISLNISFYWVPPGRVSGGGGGGGGRVGVPPISIKSEFSKIVTKTTCPESKSETANGTAVNKGKAHFSFWEVLGGKCLPAFQKPVPMETTAST